jgi:hypothetical protein
MNVDIDCRNRADSMSDGNAEKRIPVLVWLTEHVGKHVAKHVAQKSLSV